MLTGEYRNTIDEKGRILIPSKLRAALGDNNALIITRAVESCLWLMLPPFFENIRKKIMDGPGAMFDANLRLLQRRIIAPAMECEIDKSGRLLIPPQLRDGVGLAVKEESVLLGISTYLELWSVPSYEKFLSDSEPSFSAASQSLSSLLQDGGY
ncbi:division/cell wall cluster transcriptional repressor MraZ [Pleomorphochaeta sp. DL1XJH-081]|jgi:MraZ protein|uniref:division/cell wall cluster transcriptional repressor MraZ n=1 Tax=Pleomorphochaeta sp. DL1XJH-081 TaxID=3409690 RepID=UPI003BB798EF